jgi:hypothetical protein
VRTEDGSVLAVVRPDVGTQNGAFAVGGKLRIAWPREQMVMLQGA